MDKTKSPRAAEERWTILLLALLAVLKDGGRDELGRAAFRPSCALMGRLSARPVRVQQAPE